MKKLIAVLAAILLLICSGCAVSDKTEDIPEPVPSEAPEPVDEELGKLRISELMSENSSTIRDSKGDFSPWIELCNVSGESLSLSGWAFSTDGENFSFLPERELGQGEYELIFLSDLNPEGKKLKLSPGKELCLYTPGGSLSQSIELPELPDDFSYEEKNGELRQCKYPSPGLLNTPESYDALQAELITDSPLIISEAMSSNNWDQFSQGLGDRDWVELKNVSDTAIALQDYYLSDSPSDYYKYKLPEKSLKPGEYIVLLCSEESSNIYSSTGFRLNSGSEQLYLSTSEGLKDYISLRDIPAKCSYGRRSGENGGFYFENPSPGRGNSGGERRVSETPVSESRDGVFNGVTSADCVLSGEGTIYYTLDGKLPTVNSAVYEGPIKIDETCVIIASALQDGALMSRPLTLSYIMNENHSLPVMSLSSGDPAIMHRHYFGGHKGIEIPGSIAFYEGEDSFKINCGISLTGNNSLRLMKKSLKLQFRGAYGEDTLNYDVFGTGQDEYCSLALRAGQDNHRLIYRQEIWQDIGFKMGDRVPNQHSKFCILYMDGVYKGIFCLKEDMSRDYYAKLRGVSKDSVEGFKLLDMDNADFKKNVYNAISDHDMSEPENYRELCQHLDIDSLIDWVLIQGFSGNIDLFNNIRFFRSDECGGLWQPALYDLDHSLMNDFNGGFSLSSLKLDDNLQFEALFKIKGFSSKYMTRMLQGLIKNEEFRLKLTERYSELYDTVLTNENILERMDYYEKLLAPEVERDWTYWYNNPEIWGEYVEYARNLVTESDWAGTAVDNFCRYMGIDREQRLEYFP